MATATQTYELDGFKLEIRQAAGIWHINAISLLNTAHSPEVNTYCIIGENGELLVAPYEFYAATVGIPVLSARGAMKTSIHEESMVVFPYGERPDGGPDGRLRRTYAEVQCLRAAIKGTRKADGYKSLCCGLLDSLRDTMRKVDAGALGSHLAGSLRTSYEHALQARRPRKCAGTIDTVTTAEVLAEPAVSEDVVTSVTQDVHTTEDADVLDSPVVDSSTEAIFAAEPDGTSVSNEFDTMSVVADLLSKGRERNELMLALATLIKAERSSNLPADAKLEEVAKAWVNVKEAAAKLAAEGGML